MINRSLRALVWGMWVWQWYKYKKVKSKLYPMTHIDISGNIQDIYIDVRGAQESELW